MARSGTALTVGFFDLSPNVRAAAKQGITIPHEVVQARLTALGDAVRAAGGAVIKQIGDELMCAFPAAGTAVELAARMEAGLDDLVGDGEMLQLRVGLHHGAVVHEDGDLFGDTVNIAARMASIAFPGQIICTEEVIAELPMEQRDTARLFDHVTMKGSQRERTIYRILWSPRSETAGEAAISAGDLTDERTLVLEYGARTLRLRAGAEELRLGRDARCELVVSSEMASRFHATIASRRGKFLLRDQSTNGTWVGMQESPIVTLQREELPLIGTGVISLGQDVREAHMHLIRFALD